MKIERIYILTYKGDVRRAQCCVASVRRWYPDIPISLIKDEGQGAFDTTDLERWWNVDIFQTGKRDLGHKLGQLEVLFQPQRERCLILDADTAFAGPVLDFLEKFDEDFIVNTETLSRDEVCRYYFDLDGLATLEPGFTYRGFTFNAGQYVATTGLVSREDFHPYISFGEPAEALRPDIFRGYDQGPLNFVLLWKAQRGEITVRHESIMHWPHRALRQPIRVRDLTASSPHCIILHWIGPQSRLFTLNPLGRVLKHFEAAYYARIPAGRRKRSFMRIRNLPFTLYLRSRWWAYMAVQWMRRQM